MWCSASFLIDSGVSAGTRRKSSDAVASVWIVFEACAPMWPDWIPRTFSAGSISDSLRLSLSVAVMPNSRFRAGLTGGIFAIAACLAGGGGVFSFLEGGKKKWAGSLRLQVEGGGGGGE